MWWRGGGGVTHLFTHRGLCRKKRSFYLHVVVASCVFECSRSHLHSCDRAAAVKVTQTGGNVMAAFKIIMCTAGAYLYERQGLHYCGREAQVQVWEKRGRGEGFCFLWLVATHHLLHFLTHTQPKIFQTSRLPRNKEPLGSCWSRFPPLKFHRKIVSFPSFWLRNEPICDGGWQRQSLICRGADKHPAKLGALRCFVSRVLQQWSSRAAGTLKSWEVATSGDPVWMSTRI